MLLSKFLKKKAHSKKGFTLVEALASVIILAIVCVGVLNAVAFSREMVFTNNAREKSSDKAQLVAEEIVAAATGENPNSPSGDPIASIAAKVNDITNVDGSEQVSEIGKVALVSSFHSPTSDDEMIQYTITPITDDVSTDEDITITLHEGGGTRDTTQKIHKVGSQAGWDIRVRAYYKRIGNAGDYRCVDVSAFAPKDYVNNGR